MMVTDSESWAESESLPPFSESDSESEPRIQ